MPSMLNHWEGFRNFLPGLINLVSIPSVHVFYPQTKGHPLRETNVIFAKAYFTGDRYVGVAGEMQNLVNMEERVARKSDVVYRW